MVLSRASRSNGRDVSPPYLSSAATLSGLTFDERRSVHDRHQRLKQDNQRWQHAKSLANDYLRTQKRSMSRKSLPGGSSALNSRASLTVLSSCESKKGLRPSSKHTPLASVNDCYKSSSQFASRIIETADNQLQAREWAELDVKTPQERKSKVVRSNQNSGGHSAQQKRLERLQKSVRILNAKLGGLLKGYKTRRIIFNNEALRMMRRQISDFGGLIHYL